MINQDGAAAGRGGMSRVAVCVVALTCATLGIHVQTARASGPPTRIVGTVTVHKAFSDNGFYPGTAAGTFQIDAPISKSDINYYTPPLFIDDVTLDIFPTSTDFSGRMDAEDGSCSTSFNSYQQGELAVDYNGASESTNDGPPHSVTLSLSLQPVNGTSSPPYTTCGVEWVGATVTVPASSCCVFSGSRSVPDLGQDGVDDLTWNLRFAGGSPNPQSPCSPRVLPSGAALPSGCEPLSKPDDGKTIADKETMVAADGTDVVLSCGDAFDESDFADDVTGDVPILGDVVEAVAALHDVKDCISAQKEMMEEALGDPPDPAYARLYLPSVSYANVNKLAARCRKLARRNHKLCSEMAADVARLTAADATREAALRGATVAHNRYASATQASDTAAQSLQAATIRLFYGEIGSAISARNAAARDLAKLLTKNHANVAPSQDALNHEKERLLSGQDGASTALSQVRTLGYSQAQAQQALGVALNSASTSPVTLTGLLRRTLPSRSFLRLYDSQPPLGVASIAGSFKLGNSARTALTRDLVAVQKACTPKSRVKAGKVLLSYIARHLSGSARTYISQAAEPLTQYQKGVSAALSSCH